MKSRDVRHYTEEEILMHVLGEEIPSFGDEISSHLADCGQCSAVSAEFRSFRDLIASWEVPAVREAAWAAQKNDLMAEFRRDRALMREGVWGSLFRGIQNVWTYAIENPLPTMAYIAAAVAFASERTITVFHLDSILPATGEVLEILRRIL